MLNISVSSLLAGFIFGTIGLWMMREGKKKSDPRIIVIGILLMVYSYLTPNPWFDWGVGSALCFTAYRFWS